MECVFGLAGNGFAIVVADTSAGDGILLRKKDEDKIMVIDSHKLIAGSGERGDRVQFTEYIQKHVSLYQFCNGIPLTTAAAANFTRGELATALRKNLYSVNILMAGYDKESGASLYSIDYLGTLHKVEKGAFGHGAYLSLSTMDRHYRRDMSFVDAYHLVNDCISEIRSRLVIAPPNFVVKMVDKDGARHFFSTDRAPLYNRNPTPLYNRNRTPLFTSSETFVITECEAGMNSIFVETEEETGPNSIFVETEGETGPNSIFVETEEALKSLSVDTEEETAPSAPPSVY